ncbi:hypothetical protein [Paenibacillus sp. MMS18-CY102]|uniref:hypothetical protein n=1 Tax=Paenibacillus sp. MMS18-CY102 TaxID=2682849 RepID=UPI001365DD4D|nr:hypothetical protein [Paenibacillus sp. MMS18-CY102]MWC28454.1 hypothetical protein [Paenibacillus sp. MMS18-CY102]
MMIQLEQLERMEFAMGAIAELMNDSGARWIVGGSTGLALRGIGIGRPPRDLDLYSDLDSALLLHKRLERYSVDQQHWSETDRYQSLLSHYVIETVPVEVVGGFVVQAHGCRYALEVNDWLLGHSLEVQCNGKRLHVVPLSHELLFNVLRDRTDRADIIVQAAIETRAASELADQLVELSYRNVLQEELIAPWLLKLRGREGGLHDER